MDAAFSEDEKKELREKIKKEQAEAEGKSHDNWQLDLGFKWGLIITSLVTTIFAGFANVESLKDTTWIGLVPIVTGAVAAALAAASTQTNLPERQDVYSAKAQAYENLLDHLEYLEPGKEIFLERLDLVRSWHASTKPQKAHLPPWTETEVATETTPP